MKVSLNWLTDYVDVSAVPVRELAEALTRIGLCCDEIIETDADVVLDLEVTANRPDCLGHIGVAREAAAALGLALTLPDLSSIPAGETPAADLAAVDVLDPDLCPRYTARVITGVTVGPSPAWMVERLEAVGLRGINNVVDATNYVLLEYSQPLHAFDHDRLAEHRIVVRRGRAGEELLSIDQTRCTLNDGMLVIADAAEPVALAGIMGGLDSEVGASTVNVLIEAAQFDPLVTRTTARALSLMTEASYRFERGIDPVGVDAASLRACQLIIRMGGGRLAPGLVDVWAAPHAAATVRLRTARCRALLGIDVPDDTQAAILDRLGLSAKLADGVVTCAIPPHRPDLTREADLIEEVARLHGYEKVPTRRTVAHPVVGVSRDDAARNAVREVLSAAGFDEAITFAFVDDAEAALFGFDAVVRADPTVRRTNNVLRPTLLPSLLRASKHNQDVGNDDVNLYEIAAVFPRGAGDLPDEAVALSMATRRDLAVVRGALEAVVAHVAPSATLEIFPSPAAGLAEGASAQVRIDAADAGVIGMASPEVLDFYGLETPHAVASVRTDPLLAKAGDVRTYRPLPRLPAIRRDLSLTVDEAVTWAELDRAIRDGNDPMLEAVAYVGTYRGRQVAKGRKSVTICLTYRRGDETLRHETVNTKVDALVAALAERLGAELRA